jgi:hypothetical protein
MTEGPSLEYARALKCKIIYVPAGQAGEYAPLPQIHTAGAVTAAPIAMCRPCCA